MHIYPLFLNTATTSHMPVWLPFPALTVPPPPFALRYCRRRRRDTTTHAPARRPRRAKPQRRGAAVERRPDGERVVYIKGCALVEPSSLPSSHRVWQSAIEPSASHRGWHRAIEAAIEPSSHRGLMPTEHGVTGFGHRAMEARYRAIKARHRASPSRHRCLGSGPAAQGATSRGQAFYMYAWPRGRMRAFVDRPGAGPGLGRRVAARGVRL